MVSAMNPAKMPLHVLISKTINLSYTVSLAPFMGAFFCPDHIIFDKAVILPLPYAYDY